MCCNDFISVMIITLTVCLSSRDVNKPEQKEADSAAPTAKQEEEPEKDAITEAMEQEEKEDLPPPPKEETVTA